MVIFYSHVSLPESIYCFNIIFWGSFFRQDDLAYQVDLCKKKLAPGLGKWRVKPTRMCTVVVFFASTGGTLTSSKLCCCCCCE